MAKRPTAHIVHQTPSRMRLRIPEKRNDKRYFDAVVKLLGDLLGAEVEANPATSSILVYGADAAKLLLGLGDKSPFDIADDRQESGVTLPQLRQQFQGWNDRLSHFLGGGADARSYIIMALIATSVLQVARGRTLAPAVTLLWYASEGLRLWTPAQDQRPR